MFRHHEYKEGIPMDKKVLYKLSYGMYAVTSLDGTRPVGCAANCAMQITSSPVTVAISMNNKNYTTACIRESKKFALSIFSDKSNLLSIGTLGFQSSKDVDKFTDIPVEYHDGMPVISDGCGYGLFKVIDTLETSTHVLFIGEMYEGEVLSDENPMSYAYYREVIKGTAGKNSPTCQMVEGVWTCKEKWRCRVCGYIYEGEIPFEDLPDDWVCPLCKHPKSDFEKIEGYAAPQ